MKSRQIIQYSLPMQKNMSTSIQLPHCTQQPLLCSIELQMKILTYTQATVLVYRLSMGLTVMETQHCPKPRCSMVAQSLKKGFFNKAFYINIKRWMAGQTSPPQP